MNKVCRIGSKKRKHEIKEKNFELPSNDEIEKAAKKRCVKKTHDEIEAAKKKNTLCEKLFYIIKKLRYYIILVNKKS
jgi:hypothetical protein